MDSICGDDLGDLRDFSQTLESIVAEDTMGADHADVFESFADQDTA